MSRPEGHFAAFDTQVWGTGQDQCATIKRNLCLLLPGASVFLDVDDLKSIDALEEYIDQSQVGFERRRPCWSLPIACAHNADGATARWHRRSRLTAFARQRRSS